MRVLHLLTTPEGGAARVALNLSGGLVQAGVESTLLAMRGNGVPVVQRPASLLTALQRARHRWDFRAFRQHLRAAGRPRWERFSDDRAPASKHLAAVVGDCDILHLHWISDFVNLGDFFLKLPSRVKIVWTMHDAWAFTGGCHFPEGCDRFTEACGRCPQWGSSSENDFSHGSLLRRDIGYAGLSPDRSRLVAPSHWLAGLARRSRVFRDREVAVIRNGIAGFVRQDRAKARRELNLPQDADVVLFLADSGDNRRKGLALLAEALPLVESHRERILLVVGGACIDAPRGWEVRALGYVTGSESLSLAYSAASVFVHPALEDNLPSTVLEALACGTRVVGFSVGGLPELVTSPELGCLAWPVHFEPLAAALSATLHRSQRQADVPIGAAVSVEQMTSDYLDLYAELHR